MNTILNDFLTSTATDPLFWASLALAPYITIPITAIKYIDKRARLMEASDMRDELALDPYVFTREAYRQNRLYRIYDGNPPASETNDDDDWEDEDVDEENEKTVEESGLESRIRIENKPDAKIDPAPTTGLGIESRIYPVNVRNRTWYRLRSSEHANLAKARIHLQELKSRTGLTGSWIEEEKH